ncbi:quinon protein alcohol dehydrogenase-like superfamily [Mycena olivaceomarginata]|nr:quinon protein alcohol dehydrogenase-like superfamily [Mycena olivaceomarginata]
MPASFPEYTRQPGLENHPGTILALALTTDGKTLVTGGSAGTRTWDSKKLTKMARPAVASVRGATTVLLCVRRVDEPVDVIFSGTANGYIFCWRNRKGRWEETFAFQIDQPTDITGIAFDASTSRLIICSSGGRIVAWGATRNESNRMHLSKVFSRQINNFEPRSITFAGYKLRGKAGEIAEEWSIGGPIGDAQVDWKEGVVLFDDIFSGPSLWQYHDYTRVKMYYIRGTRDYGRIRNVRFAEGATAVVCGSDHGLVYVFNLQTGERLQKLDTGSGEWVQAIATAEVNGVPTIFAAPTRTEDGDVTLFVWKRLEPEPEAKPSRFWATAWLYLIRIIVVCCCIGFLVQNLRGLLHTTVEATPNITAEAQEVGGVILTWLRQTRNFDYRERIILQDLPTACMETLREHIAGFASSPSSRACPQEGIAKVDVGASQASVSSRACPQETIAMSQIHEVGLAHNMRRVQGGNRLAATDLLRASPAEVSPALELASGHFKGFALCERPLGSQPTRHFEGIVLRERHALSPGYLHRRFQGQVPWYPPCTMGPKVHTCKCALEEFPHEVPHKDWLPHQAQLRAFQSRTSSLEDETNLIALQTARIVLSDNPESTSENPSSVDPQFLFADMQQSIGHLPKPPTRKKQVAPVIRAQNVFAALTSYFTGSTEFMGQSG